MEPEGLAPDPCAPAAGGWGWRDGVQVPTHPDGLATPGKLHGGKRIPGGEVPTQPPTFGPSDLGRLCALRSPGFRLRETGGDARRPQRGGRGARRARRIGGAEGVNAPGPPPLSAPPPAAGREMSGWGRGPVPVPACRPRAASPAQRPALTPPPPRPGPPCLWGEWGPGAVGRGGGNAGLPLSRGPGGRGGRVARRLGAGEMPRWVPGAGSSFPGTDGLARRRPEMPDGARRLDPPVGGGGLGARALSPTREGLLHLGRPSSSTPSGSPSSGPRASPFPSLPSSSLPSPEGLFPTNPVGRCR